VKVLARLSAFLLAVVATTETAWACVCLDLSARELLGQSKSVFRGTLVEAGEFRRPSPDEPAVMLYADQYRFRVLERFKGQGRLDVQLLSGGCELRPPSEVCGNTCGAVLSVGRDYLVFAADELYGELAINTCTVFSGPSAARKTKDLRRMKLKQPPQNNELQRTKPAQAMELRR
jgi:hypothetical protein